MHIVMIGDTAGPDNYHVGDEAMLEANVHYLRQYLSKVSFTLISRNPRWATRYFGETAVPYIGFPLAHSTRAERELILARVLENARNVTNGHELDDAATGKSVINAVQKANAIFISGGGNLFPRTIQHVYERAALIKIAEAMDKPVIVSGQQIGPELDDECRGLLSDTLPNARLVGVRDKASQKMAYSLGVSPTRTIYQADDAFFMPEPDANSHVYELAHQLNHPWIAVNMPSLGAGRTNRKKWAKQLRAVADDLDVQLVFIPHHDVGNKETAKYSGLVPHIENASNKHVVISTFLNSRECAWLTRQANMVLGARYHHITFGMSGTVPCLTVLPPTAVLRAKYLGMLEHAGMSEWVIEKKYAMAGGLSHATRDLWNKRASISSYLASQQSHWRMLHDKRWETVLAELDSRGKSQPSSQVTPVAREPISHQYCPPSDVWRKAMHRYMWKYRRTGTVVGMLKRLGQVERLG